jgi:oligosaccharide repeat unit polymerase
MDGDFGGNTFRFFIAVAAALGLADRPRSLVQDFVGVPHMTNLYTIYFHYVKDFGLIGVILIPLFLGFVHGRIFRWAMVAGIRERSDFAIYILSLSYLPLLQAIFQESHFTSLSTWIQFVVVGILMTRRNSLRTIHGF